MRNPTPSYMKRTQLESIGLIWHLLQMVIVTYLLAAPKRSVIDLAPFVWALVVIPFALGCWIGGLLQRPTAVTLLLAAVYWTAVAVHLEGPFIFSFSLGITSSRILFLAYFVELFELSST